MCKAYVMDNINQAIIKIKMNIATVFILKCRTAVVTLTKCYYYVKVYVAL